MRALRTIEFWQNGRYVHYSTDSCTSDTIDNLRQRQGGNKDLGWLRVNFTKNSKIEERQLKRSDETSWVRTTLKEDV